MAGDDVFADLDKQLEEAEKGTDSEPDETPDDAEATDVEPTPSEGADDEGGPAFEFSNDMQQSIYIRDEVWDAFVDTVDFEVKRELRNEDVREVTGREIQDAALRVATEHPEEIVEKFLELRREG